MLQEGLQRYTLLRKCASNRRKHAGLISRGRNAQYRPCRLEAEHLDTAVEWIERNKQVWKNRFDRLEQHLRDIQHPQSHEADKENPR